MCSGRSWRVSVNISEYNVAWNVMRSFDISVVIRSLFQTLRKHWSVVLIDWLIDWLFCLVRCVINVGPSLPSPLSSSSGWSFHLYFVTFISPPPQRSPSPLPLFLQSQSSCLVCKRSWLVDPQSLKRSLWLVSWSVFFKRLILIGCSARPPPIRMMGGRSFRCYMALWSALWLVVQLCYSVRTTAARCPLQPIRASRAELHRCAPPSQRYWELWEMEAVTLICWWLLGLLCVCLLSHTSRWVWTRHTSEFLSY